MELLKGKSIARSCAELIGETIVAIKEIEFGDNDCPEYALLVITKNKYAVIQGGDKFVYFELRGEDEDNIWEQENIKEYSL